MKEILLDDSYFEVLLATSVFGAAMPARSSADQVISVWNNSMKQRLTTNCVCEKLADPTCADLMDAFGNAWKGYVSNRVEMLLSNPAQFLPTHHDKNP